MSSDTSPDSGSEDEKFSIELRGERWKRRLVCVTGNCERVGVELRSRYVLISEESPPCRE